MSLPRNLTITQEWFAKAYSLFRRFAPSGTHHKEKIPLWLRSGDNIIKDFSFYACPLCLKSYIIEVPALEIVGFASEFSLDHFPQQSIGGTHTALVCKKCNNDSGGLFESALKDLLNFKEFIRGIPEVPISIRSIIPTDGLSFKGKLSFDKDKVLRMDLGAKGRNSKIEDLFKSLQSGSEVNFNIQYKKPSKEKLSKSILKTAYLICFHEWGYDFVVSNTGKMIRECLFGSEEYPISVPCFSLDKIIADPIARKGVLGISYHIAQDIIKCFVVTFPMKSKMHDDSELISVLIPAYGEGEWQLFKQLKFVMQDGLIFNGRLDRVESEMMLPIELDGYKKSSEILKGL